MKDLLLVRNKAGTGSRDNCPCGSWRKHWENFSGKPWPYECSNLICDNIATDGCHVVDDLSEDNTEYIVPLCSECNNPRNTDSFFLKDGVIPVPANTNKTCKRR